LKWNVPHLLSHVLNCTEQGFRGTHDLVLRLAGVRDVPPEFFGTRLQVDGKSLVGSFASHCVCCVVVLRSANAEVGARAQVGGSASQGVVAGPGCLCGNPGDDRSLPMVAYGKKLRHLHAVVLYLSAIARSRIDRKSSDIFVFVSYRGLIGAQDMTCALLGCVSCCYNKTKQNKSLFWRSRCPEAAPAYMSAAVWWQRLNSDIVACLHSILHYVCFIPAAVLYQAACFSR
jgi:hypothetical protein